MKKFAILQSTGTYAIINGKTVIDCTVKSLSVYADSDNYAELYKLCESLNAAKHYNNGVWCNYSVAKRAHAKRDLRAFKEVNS